ncbi:hypothetical protein VKT23_000944 [Stygiomarasmius scandens]|uniref:Uncharacterized protein n=1 Tax=Marasmiellus scandens TaxID=2682957 RepID=A0ABR1K6Q2_9AGAR
MSTITVNNPSNDDDDHRQNPRSPQTGETEARPDSRASEISGMTLYSMTGVLEEFIAHVENCKIMVNNLQQQLQETQVNPDTTQYELGELFGQLQMAEDDLTEARIARYRAKHRYRSVTLSETLRRTPRTSLAHEMGTMPGGFATEGDTLTAAIPPQPQPTSIGQLLARDSLDRTQQREMYRVPRGIIHETHGVFGDNGGGEIPCPVSIPPQHSERTVQALVERDHGNRIVSDPIPSAVKGKQREMEPEPENPGSPSPSQRDQNIDLAVRSLGAQRAPHETDEQYHICQNALH